MISLLREFTKSWIFTLLMGVLILSFAVFGLKDVFSSVSDNVVIKAGGREMTTAEFKKRYDDYRQRVTEGGGKPQTNEEFVAAGMDEAMVQAYAGQLAYAAWLDALGVKPSPRLMVEQISKVPAFFNQITGKFDKDSYRQALARAEMTQTQFEQETSDQIAAQQYSNAALIGLKAPRIYNATQAAVYLQSRDASFFLLSPNNVANPAPPTEADILAYYKANAKQLSQPEVRQASVVQFSPGMFAASFQPSDEELRALYQASLSRLATPEVRSFVKVTAPNAGAAAKIATALKAGQDPQTVAKANKGEVITYDLKPKGSEPDAAVATAAFALQTGEVSGPIKGDLGYAVVKMGDIRTSATPSFENVKPRLVEEYRQEKAADKVNTLVNEFQKALDSGENFSAAAKRLGLSVHKLDPMDSEGKTGKVDPKTGQPIDYTAYPALVRNVFDLAPGTASEVQEMGNGEYIAVRLDDVKPAGVVPLDAPLKLNLGRMWMQEKMAAAVAAKAEDVTRRLAAGEDFAKVAAELRAEVQKLPLDRASAQEMSQRLGQAFVSRVFSTDAGKSFQAPVGPVATIIGRVDAVHEGDPKAVAAISSQMGAQMVQSISRDIDDMTRTSATKLVKTKTFIAAADRALDVTPKGAKKDAKADASTKAKP